jgi:FHA domain-containing protein
VIKISVASYNNTPNTQGLAFTFDELGGTIGRADTNQLILPDPERSISRVHAQVVFRNGRFSLIDKGSNPVSVNGKALGNGAEATVQAGDQVQIGGYLLLVESALGGASVAPVAAPPAPVAAPGGDPFAGFWSPTPAPANSPFGAPSGAPRVAPAASAGGIPADWDPFGSPAPAPMLASPAPSSSDPLAMFGQPSASQMAKASESSIDSLFGLGAPTGQDPFSQSPLGTGLGGPNTANDLDPLRALGLAKDPGLAAMSDQGSDLNTPFMAPAGTPSKAPVAAPTSTDPFAHLGAPLAPLAAPSGGSFGGGSAGGGGGGGAMLLPDDFDFLSPAPPAAAAPALAPVMAPPPAAVLPPSPMGAVVSWGDTGSAEGRTLIKPKARPAEAQSPTATPAAFATPTAPASVPPVAAATPTTPATPLAPTSHLPQGDEAKALLQAFKQGLGTPTVQIDALTPDVMRLIGQLLHDSAQGTVDLLVARAALKREVRAEVTMIVAQKNNPLKFSPTVEVALNHLLSPPQRGFMPASQAMQDAYDDLRAHQFGFMAGMKAALDGVLKRFDPAQLEGKLTQKSMLQSLLPATRKARMWEVFQELYAQISAEASDDFHELFGKAFLKAYEAHIDELHNERDRHQR